MPSPVAHIGFALGFGSLIMVSTKGSFTPVHCLILAWNAFLGPDLGAFIGWCFSVTFPFIADQAMEWVHDSAGYIFLIAPCVAFLSSRFVRRLSRTNYSSTLNLESSHRNPLEPLLTFRRCYLLAIAGCLLHFQLDHIFEQNGADRLYRWILSTGYFSRPTPPLSPFSIILVGLSTLVLFGGFVWIHLLSSTLSKQSLETRLKYTFGLFFVVFGVYLSCLIVSQLILGYKAVVGEEADLGVLIFIIAFHFSPFILCLLSIR